MMKWFLKRLSENSTRTALVTAMGAGIGVASGAVDSQTAIGALFAAVLAFITPNNGSPDHG